MKGDIYYFSAGGFPKRSSLASWRRIFQRNRRSQEGKSPGLSFFVRAVSIWRFALFNQSRAMIFAPYQLPPRKGRETSTQYPRHRNPVLPQAAKKNCRLVVTAMSKFRVSFGDPVNLERNFAKMALAQSLRFGLMEINRINYSSARAPLFLILGQRENRYSWDSILQEVPLQYEANDSSLLNEKAQFPVARGLKLFGWHWFLLPGVARGLSRKRVPAL